MHLKKLFKVYQSSATEQRKIQQILTEKVLVLAVQRKKKSLVRLLKAINR